jgi:uncharacterized membrane protein YeaQ/YmgE (transglycosylase-associated protein family)
LRGGRHLALLASKARRATATTFGRQQREGFFLRLNLNPEPSSMPDLPLSPAAEHWVHIVLIWIGFGTLAGLLASAVFPLCRPAGPFGAAVAGIVGSTVGLLGLHWIFPSRPLNPISLWGFLAATVGALALLTLYRLFCAVFQGRERGSTKS